MSKSKDTRIPQAETAAEIQAARRALEKAKATHVQTAAALREARDLSATISQALADVASGGGSHEEMSAAYDVLVADYNSAQQQLTKATSLHAGATRVANEAAAAVTRLAHADQILRVEKLFGVLTKDMGQLAEIVATAEPIRQRAVATMDKIRAAWPGGGFAPLGFNAGQVNRFLANEIWRVTNLDAAHKGIPEPLPWPAPEPPLRTGEGVSVPLAVRALTLPQAVADYAKWASDLMRGRRRFDGKPVSERGPDVLIPATPEISGDLEPDAVPADDLPVQSSDAEIYAAGIAAGTLRSADQIMAKHQAEADARRRT